MSQEERFGTRDRTYSEWHRRMSTRRFVGLELAQSLAMIDLDAALYVEYDDKTKEPLALMELAADVGQSYKNGTVTRKLAERAGIRAYVVLYTASDQPNPAKPEFKDISGFRYRRLWPLPETDDWHTATPAQWARLLLKVRSAAANDLDEKLRSA